MASRPDEPGSPDPEEGPTQGESRPNAKRSRTRRLLRLGGVLLALVLVVVLGYGGYVYYSLHNIPTSHAIDKIRAHHHGKAIDLLVMGLDSRLGEDGKPLPRKIYKALHAGGAGSGGLNANVLMFIHIPADGSRATAFSIPRDDYVKLVGCPDGECHEKIKEAYGLATDQAQRKLAAEGRTGPSAYQRARDAGRRAEVRTVEKFLGVRVNEFVEVTMAAFYEIAKVVEPIQVCVKENTQDTYSGAHFHKGRQWLNARQAVAFVRQRRDTSDPSLNFTDLDRERRQQAFIVSLLTQLKSAHTLLDPRKVMGIIDVAKANVVISSGLDPVALARLAAHLSGGDLNFYTLPVKSFGTDPQGQDINVVDPAATRRTVHRILHSHARTGKHHGHHHGHRHQGPKKVSATGGGRTGPPPTALTDLGGGGIPCVK